MRILVVSFLAAGLLQGAEPADATAAVQKSLALLQGSAYKFWEGSSCISCHHQSLVAMAVATAREHGFKVDEEAARKQVELTFEYMNARRERVIEGYAPPGVQDTMSYILFGLAVEHAPGNAATEAGARYLKLHQAVDGHVPMTAHRPPLEASQIGNTALSIRDLEAYAPLSQPELYAARVAKAAEWLATAEARSNEEYAFKILGLVWGHGSTAAIRETSDQLVRMQREDGGWSQLASLESDSYASGQALVALQSGGMKTTDPVYQRGVAFLLKSQLPDGSWHVKSRSDPIQIYFETGYPYGKDQFISVAGASWAVTAIALTKPVRATQAKR
jgi:N-acyl-D-amino-acid deacylase